MSKLQTKLDASTVERIESSVLTALQGKTRTTKPIIDDIQINDIQRGEEQPSPAQIAALIDHTALKPTTTSAEIKQLCEEAIAHQFASVCVNLTWIPLCHELLADGLVKCCTVIGFPLGSTSTAVKAFETERALGSGAQEVDMVLNVGRLKDGDYAAVFEDIQAVAEAAHAGDALAKVIFETALLTTEEKFAACIICKEAGADFVKTATGFNGGGATVEDIRLMHSMVGSTLGVKASGGVRTRDDAIAMITAGASRIGASAGVQIVQGDHPDTSKDSSSVATERSGSKESY